MNLAVRKLALNRGAQCTKSSFITRQLLSTQRDLIISDSPVEKVILQSHRTAFAFARDGDKASNTVVIAIHGSVGSHRDFRYLAGALNSLNVPAELIRVDLPGFGDSDNLQSLPNSQFYSNVLWDAITTIYPDCKSKRIVIVGHSVAGHILVEMALAAPLPSSVMGIAFLSSIGLEPHKGLGGKFLFPYVIYWANYLDHPTLGHFMRRTLLFFYISIFGFSKQSTLDVILTSHKRVCALDFNLFNEQLLRLPSCVSAFHAYAQDDHLIQSDLQQRFAAALPAGPRLEWSTGGHNIQKTRSLEIASEMKEWIVTMNASQLNN